MNVFVFWFKQKPSGAAEKNFMITYKKVEKRNVIMIF